MTAALAVLACGLPQPADFAAPDALFVAVVLDDSGSMGEPMPGARGSKMDAAKVALTEAFAALPDSARVGLFTLNNTWSRDGDGGAARETGHEAFAVGEVPPAEAAAAVREVVPGGGTPLGERLREAADALRAARATHKYGAYRLLVVTDGEATDRELLDAVVPRALGAGLAVDVIGVAMAGDHTLATRVDRYRSADDPAALSAALAEVLAESPGTAGAGDPDDGGAASDYDLIAPLPDAAATAALAALEADDAAPLAVDAPAPPAAPPAPRVPNLPGGVNVQVDGDPLGGLCCCLPPVALAAAAGFVLFRAFGGRRRRR